MTCGPEKVSSSPEGGCTSDRGLYPAGPSREHETSNERDKVRVELPEEPPELTPRAARALLWIIRRAYAQERASCSSEKPPTRGDAEDGPDTPRS